MTHLSFLRNVLFLNYKRGKTPHHSPPLPLFITKLLFHNQSPPPPPPVREKRQRDKNNKNYKN